MKQKIVAPNAENESDHTAADREQEAFTQQLPDDTPTRRTERKAQRNLLSARSRAGKQHVGKIQARDQ